MPFKSMLLDLVSKENADNATQVPTLVYQVAILVMVSRYIIRKTTKIRSILIEFFRMPELVSTLVTYTAPTLVTGLLENTTKILNGFGGQSSSYSC